MPGPQDARRHARRGAKLLRQAMAEFAQAADAAEAEQAVPASVVGQLHVDPQGLGDEGAAVLARTIAATAGEHGALDVLLIADHPATAPTGAQEEPHGREGEVPDVRRRRASQDARERDGEARR